MPSRPLAAAVLTLVAVAAAGCRLSGDSRPGATSSPPRDPALQSAASMRTALTEIRDVLVAAGSTGATADERVGQACARLARLEEAVRTDLDARERVGYGGREVLRLRVAMHDCPEDLGNARTLLHELIDPPRNTPPPTSG